MHSCNGGSVFFSGICTYYYKKERQVICMRNLGHCLLAFILFFMATVAILEIDRQCREMTNYGGEITASAELIVEKMGPLR